MGNDIKSVHRAAGVRPACACDWGDRADLPGSGPALQVVQWCWTDT